MTRIWIILLTVVVALAMAMPAGAKKGGNKPPDPDPIVGMTCEGWFGESTPVEWDGNTFTLSWTTHMDQACVDVDGVPAGDWIVDVRVGEARSVTVALRSSIPGDWCWVESTKDDTVFSFPDTPASIPNACPIGGAGGESILDEAPPLAFTVLYYGKKTLEDGQGPVVAVTLP